eukprot:scaffold122974_cov53-Attheya_sp.AAC.5
MAVGYWFRPDLAQTIGRDHAHIFARENCEFGGKVDRLTRDGGRRGSHTSHFRMQAATIFNILLFISGKQTGLRLEV